MRFEFSTSNRIIFGEGTTSELPAAARTLGTRALLVTGASADRSSPHRKALNDAGVPTDVFRTSGEPTVDTIRDGLAAARTMDCDLVIALGGGSAIDAGKAIAGLMPNEGEVYDYLEVVGAGNPLPRPGLPVIAVPTTAGTGSEVTRNAVLAVPERRVKVSLRHASMLPRVAIVDPRMTYELPREVTASAGLDALVQLIEPWLSLAANPLVDSICREGILRIARSLRAAWMDGSNAAARADMSLAALFSGMALSNARLGAVHGFAGPIGGSYPAPHGAICGRLLPIVLRVNLNALRARAPQSATIHRFDELGILLTGSGSGGAEAAIAWLTELCNELHVPPLGTYGMRPVDFPSLIEAAGASSSMKGNPIVLEQDELMSVLQAAL